MAELTAADLYHRAVDPASAWPGAPPNFGQEVVPHIYTVAGQSGLAGHAYLNADEALRHSVENAERMRVDCGIMECLEARQRATALLDWYVRPIDPDPVAEEIAQHVTQILRRTPRFMEMRRCLLEAVWYGRYAVALQFANRPVNRQRAIVVSRWEPRHGDKLVFRYDDGSGKWPSGQVGIRMGVHGQVARHTLGINREQIEYTEHGMVYWLNARERNTLILHKHSIEDGVFEDPYTSGRIHGVGVRSRVYWTWYAMVECLQRALEYLDRSAFGVELWRYPANNPRAKADTERAALNNVGGGRSIILVPVFPGEQQDLYGVEHIEPGLGGVDRILQVIKDFFGNKIKRYILGQVLTSEAEATGLGSGVADAHLATFADIVEYDARNLSETLTEELVRPIVEFNFRGVSADLQFVIQTESPDQDKRLEALKRVWEMGMRIDVEDLAEAAGLSVPGQDADVVFNPQVVGAMLQITGESGPLQPSTQDDMQRILIEKLSGGGVLSLEA